MNVGMFPAPKCDNLSQNCRMPFACGTFMMRPSENRRISIIFLELGLEPRLVSDGQICLRGPLSKQLGGVCLFHNLRKTLKLCIYCLL